jgi:hypothetical protein
VVGTLEAFASPIEEWQRFGRVLVRCPRVDGLVLAIGKYAGRALGDVPGSYLRSILEEWEDVPPATREELAVHASSARDWARFGRYLYNDSAGELCLGIGRHAGQRLSASSVPYSYLNGMRRWSDPPPEVVLARVGAELGRRARQAQARRRARGG